MPVRIRSILVAAALLATLPLVPAPAARADHAQPPLNPALVDYTPIGHYGPLDEGGTSATVPNPSGGPPALNDPNPSGKWVAYDTNVWESLTLPSRHPNDNCNALAPDDRDPHCRSGDMDDDTTNPVARTGYTGYEGPSGTSTVHGTCPPDPEFVPWGQCFNNQLEYLDYYEHSMETSFADLGLVVHRYPFHSPGVGSRGVALDASGGQAYNISATIPGADHPEETVIVGAHYDFTDSGPAAAWDSAEGHTEVMRMAYIMADYYRKTGTRPSATLKFMPWDSEESGAHGSEDYVTNNIPPGEEAKVRGYFNVDPCAGAYPAFQEGTNDQVTQVMQLSNPAGFEDEPEVKARIESFNSRAETIIDDVLNRLDDRLTRPGGSEVPIFVSNAEAAAGADDRGPLGGAGSDRGKIATAVGGLFLFTSDYRNFDAEGIPIFNFFPDYFGPHADLTPAEGGTKGLEILHTNNDNLTRINRLTSGLTSPGNVIDPTGTFASEGWAKGMEFCAQVESWYMLQPEMGGAQTSNTNPVAYFEALPNEAIVNQGVTFDANGTYQYSDVATRTLQPDSALTYQWNFGDGTTATGKTVQHPYSAIGKYTATLTVTGAGGAQDTMTIPITVIGSNFPGPVLEQIPPADARDGNFPLNWEFTGETAGFDRFGIDESRDYRALLTDEAEDITQNWNVTPPSAPQIQPWQHSDSDTEKFLGNAHRSGERSFWTGFSPPFDPVTAMPGTSILTLKNPISVPAQGDPELSYWSLFRNESDDSAQVQVALTSSTAPPAQLDWDTVDSFSDGINTCVGTSPSGVLDTDLVNRRVDLAEFKGKEILVRFVYISGPTNPALSQPCGWYVDDISMFTGTWSRIGTSKSTQFQVTNRPNGTAAYRVKGIYTDGIETAASNVEVAQITESTAGPGGIRCPVKLKGNRVIGTVGRDILVGTPGRDVLCGGKANDTIRGRGGKDVLIGGKGKDVLRGGAGKDLLRGGQGNDILAGGAGRDTLRGGGGRDLLRGGGGKDKCVGGGGKDRERAC